MNNMNVTSAKYRVDLDGKTKISIGAEIDGIKWSVPLDPANRHYQAIQKWVSEGNTIQEAE